MSDGTHTYKDDFYSYINAGSLSSAQIVCPLLVSSLHPNSLLDVGCGAGAWCRRWIENGVHDVLGVDGDYVDRAALLVPPEHFQSQDLSKTFDLGRRFDLVVSLEVAEHVPHSSSELFVDNLIRHGGQVLFSAAVPGQGGEFHVNEQPLEFWRKLFAARGYRCFDAVRTKIRGEARVEPWYRYNTLLYVAEDRVASLPEDVRVTELQEHVSIPDVSPVSWRVRNAVIRHSPDFIVDTLVRLKHEWGRRTRTGSP